MIPIRKLHAEHNENLCSQLIVLGTYDDWVVTTAFYSCIHYVENNLFPLNENGVVYPDFDTYYSKVVIANNKRISKHNLKLSLVNTYIPQVRNAYKRLMDNSSLARYRNYRIGKPLAQIASLDLNAIKNACI